MQQQQQQRICNTPPRKLTTCAADMQISSDSAPCKDPQPDVVPGWLLISPTASLMDNNSDGSSCSPEKQELQPRSKAKKHPLTPPTPNWMKIDPEALELGSEDDELRECLQNHLARKVRKLETNKVEKTDYYMRATAMLETPDKVQKMHFRRLSDAVDVADSSNAEGAGVSNGNDSGNDCDHRNRKCHGHGPGHVNVNAQSQSHSQTQTQSHTMKLAVKVKFMVTTQD